MRLEELIEWQEWNSLNDVHIADIDDGGYRLAHTDREREDGTNDERCPYDVWMRSFDEAPADPGIYEVVLDDEGFYLLNYE